MSDYLFAVILVFIGMTGLFLFVIISEHQHKKK